MSIELKIKSKHLAVEARIIRFEERKLEKQISWLQTKNGERWRKWDTDECKAMWALHSKRESLHKHRKQDVGQENRATFLARAYLANMPYARVEQTRKPEFEYHFQKNVLPRVLTMVQKYGKEFGKHNTTREALDEWVNAEVAAQAQAAE